MQLLPGIYPPEGWWASWLFLCIRWFRWVFFSSRINSPVGTPGLQLGVWCLGSSPTALVNGRADGGILWETRSPFREHLLPRTGRFTGKIQMSMFWAFLRRFFEFLNETSFLTWFPRFPIFGLYNICLSPISVVQGENVWPKGPVGTPENRWLQPIRQTPTTVSSGAM